MSSGSRPISSSLICVVMPPMIVLIPAMVIPYQNLFPASPFSTLFQCRVSIASGKDLNSIIERTRFAGEGAALLIDEPRAFADARLNHRHVDLFEHMRQQPFGCFLAQRLRVAEV